MSDVHASIDLFDKFVAVRCLGYPTNYANNDLFLKHHFCLAPTDIKWSEDGVIVSKQYGEISPESLAQMNERQRAQLGYNRQELTRLQIGPKKLEPRQILWGPIAPDALMRDIPRRIEPSFMKKGVWVALQRIIQADFLTIRNDVIGFIERRYTDRGKPVPDYAKADMPTEQDRETLLEAQKTAIILLDSLLGDFPHLKIDRLTAGRIEIYRRETGSLALSSQTEQRLAEALILRR